MATAAVRHRCMRTLSAAVAQNALIPRLVSLDGKESKKENKKNTEKEPKRSKSVSFPLAILLRVIWKRNNGRKWRNMCSFGASLRRKTKRCEGERSSGGHKKWVATGEGARDEK